MVNFFLKHILHFFIVCLGTFLAEAEAGLIPDQIGADITGHNENDVLEIDVSSEVVGEPALFHNLQQHIVDIRMRLFDFIEQQHRIRPTSYPLG